MKVKQAIIHVAAVCLFLAGCQTPPQPQPTKPVPVSAIKKPVESKKPQQSIKNRTPEQVQMLSDFAMKESPKIWQTIQTMRAEMAESGKKVKQLRADLLEFDRDPDMDDDYKSLVVGLNDLKRAYSAIFDKLENAYIAAKKYEASPSRKDYQEIMKRALEDGIQDANMATERYKAMSRQK